MLWWSRLGTLLQGASFLVILLEVIGHKRINNFGTWLNSSIKLEFRKLSTDMTDWVLTLFTKLQPMLQFINPFSAGIEGFNEYRESMRREREMRTADDSLPLRPPESYLNTFDVTLPPEPSLLEVLKEKPVPAVIWVLSSGAAVFAYINWLAPRLGDDWVANLVNFIVTIFIIVGIGPLVTLIVANAGFALVTSFEWAIVRPITFGLRSRRIDIWIKVSATVVALVGFHFALLSG